MTPALYALFELGLSFGVVLALGLWQLHCLARAEKRKAPPGIDEAA
ncbi:hypothetical protein SAMN05444581_11434 [Methylocapsa palsarum]|uniref:Uncharacterized protein n=1 Tax=Methylocapsa palsarum TaxID=1612308 RepID=A0A1I4BCR7_9HYPH|nr:hypothetical protein SAMN05444581_11434 [Methylocapsa palsarum]